MSDTIRCSSCNKQKNDLTPKKSQLMKSITLFLCNDCIKARREPRYIIILVGRTKGPGVVTDYIKNRRYLGDEILAKELIA